MDPGRTAAQQGLQQQATSPAVAGAGLLGGPWGAPAGPAAAPPGPGPGGPGPLAGLLEAGNLAAARREAEEHPERWRAAGPSHTPGRDWWDLAAAGARAHSVGEPDSADLQTLLALFADLHWGPGAFLSSRPACTPTQKRGLKIAIDLGYPAKVCEVLRLARLALDEVHYGKTWLKRADEARAGPGKRKIQYVLYAQAGRLPHLPPAPAGGKAVRTFKSASKAFKEAIELGDVAAVQHLLGKGLVDLAGGHYGKSWFARAEEAVRTEHKQAVIAALKAHAAAHSVEVPHLELQPKLESELAKKKAALRRAIEDRDVGAVREIINTVHLDWKADHYGKSWLRRALEADPGPARDEIVALVQQASGVPLPYDFQHQAMHRAIEQGNPAEVRRLLADCGVQWDWELKFERKTLVELALEPGSSSNMQARLAIAEAICTAAGLGESFAQLKAEGRLNLGAKAESSDASKKRKASPLGAGPHSDSKVPKDGTFGGGRYQNHELKKAIEDGDLASVRQLLGGEAIDDAATFYGKTWVERAYAAKRTPLKPEIVAFIHSRARKNGATALPQPGPEVLAQFAKVGGPKGENIEDDEAAAKVAAKEAAKDKARRRPLGGSQQKDLKRAIEEGDVEAVDALLASGVFDFTLDHYGLSWVERAMMVSDENWQGDKENGDRRARLIGLVFKRACEAPRPTSTLAAKKKKKARAPASPGSPYQGESKVRKAAATHALKFKQAIQGGNLATAQAMLDAGQVNLAPNYKHYNKTWAERAACAPQSPAKQAIQTLISAATQQAKDQPPPDAGKAPIEGATVAQLMDLSEAADHADAGASSKFANGKPAA